MLKSIFIFVILISISVTPAFAISQAEKMRKAIIAAKWVEGKKIGNYELIDQDGISFNLDEYKGTPLLVSFIYTTCPDICSQIVASLGPAIQEVKEEYGDVFNAIIIGFDHEGDTPEMLKYYGDLHDIDFSMVRFASGDEETIKRLTKDFGFFFEATKDGAFNHIGLVSIVKKNFVVYKQVYGIKLKAKDINVPLNHLISGNIPVEAPLTLLEQLKAACYTIDPTTGGYVVDWPRVVGYLVQIIVFLIVVFAVFWTNMKSFFLRIARLIK